MSTQPFVYARTHHVPTFLEHVRSFSAVSYGMNCATDYALMCAGLCELEGRTGYRDLVKIDIFRQALNRQGYTANGRYFGIGADLFALDVDDGENVRTHYIRAPNRAALRAALKRLYPTARVSR